MVDSLPVPQPFAFESQKFSGALVAVHYTLLELGVAIPKPHFFLEHAERTL